MLSRHEDVAAVFRNAVTFSDANTSLSQQYYSDLVSERCRRLASDLTSALIKAEIDGDKLTDDEVIGFLFLMVVAGNETTTKLLRGRLASNPGDVPQLGFNGAGEPR